MTFLLIAGGVAMLFVGGELGFRSGIAFAHRGELERLEKLIDRVAEIDPDAIHVMLQAAQEISREEAQVMDLEKLARMK